MVFPDIYFCYQLLNCSSPITCRLLHSRFTSRLADQNPNFTLFHSTNSCKCFYTSLLFLIKAQNFVLSTKFLFHILVVFPLTLLVYFFFWHWPLRHSSSTTCRLLRSRFVSQLADQTPAQHCFTSEIVGNIFTKRTWRGEIDAFSFS